MPDPAEPRDPALEIYLASRDIPCPKCGYNLRGLTSSTCPECRYRLEFMLRPRGGWISTREGVFAMCTFFGSVAITLGAELERWRHTPPKYRSASFVASIPQPELVLIVTGAIVLVIF